jgi:hypothetical protein
MDGELCVYTAAYGDYESLRDQFIANETSVPFFCFTDDPNLESQTWEIHHEPPIFPRDPVRSQRLLKIKPPALVHRFKNSIYIDSPYSMLKNPRELFERYKPENGLTLMSHEFRNSVIDEFMAIIDHGLDDYNKIYEQLHHYMDTNPDSLLQRPYHTALIIRDNTNHDISKIMDRWAFHISRYSRRDQLSLNYVLSEFNFTPNIYHLDLYSSEYIKYDSSRRIDRNKGIRSSHGSLPKVLNDYIRLRIHTFDGDTDSAKLSEKQLNVSKISNRPKNKLRIFLSKFKYVRFLKNYVQKNFPRLHDKILKIVMK